MNQIAENLGAGENSEYQIDALNAISKALGGKHDSKYPAEALNEIAKTTNLKEVVLNHIKTTQSGVTEEKLEELTKLSTPELLQYSIHPEYVPNPDWDLSESLEKVMKKCGVGLFPVIMTANDSYNRPTMVPGGVSKLGHSNMSVGFINKQYGGITYRRVLSFTRGGGKYFNFASTGWVKKTDGSYATAGVEMTIDGSILGPNKITSLEPVFIDIRFVCKNNNTVLHPGINKNVALLCQFVVYRSSDFSIEDSETFNVAYEQWVQSALCGFYQETDVVILNKDGYTPDTLKFLLLYGGTEDRTYNAGDVLTSLGIQYLHNQVGYEMKDY